MEGRDSCTSAQHIRPCRNRSRSQHRPCRCVPRNQAPPGCTRYSAGTPCLQRKSWADSRARRRTRPLRTRSSRGKRSPHRRTSGPRSRSRRRPASIRDRRCALRGRRSRPPRSWQSCNARRSDTPAPLGTRSRCTLERTLDRRPCTGMRPRAPRGRRSRPHSRRLGTCRTPGSKRRRAPRHWAAPTGIPPGAGSPPESGRQARPARRPPGRPCPSRQRHPPHHSQYRPTQHRHSRLHRTQRRHSSSHPTQLPQSAIRPHRHCPLHRSRCRKRTGWSRRGLRQAVPGVGQDWREGSEKGRGGRS